jgi:hypothetical protein
MEVTPDGSEGTQDRKPMNEESSDDTRGTSLAQRRLSGAITVTLDNLR